MPVIFLGANKPMSLELVTSQSHFRHEEAEVQREIGLTKDSFQNSLCHLQEVEIGPPEHNGDPERLMGSTEEARG